MAMGILEVRDKGGKIINIPAIRGSRGKSAYEYAQEGGYTGTEEEFGEKLAKEMPSITQEAGESENIVMSQKAVTNFVTTTVESHINTITDSVTGIVYELHIVDGKLMLIERVD
jgi:hypothetical protein